MSVRGGLLVVPEIDVNGFAAGVADGAAVIDVREPYEYVAGHVPGAELMPMSRVHARLADLPRGERVYVICATGNRSKTAAGWLRSAGVDAVSVAGGTTAWQSQGRPVVRGPRASQSAA
jgi:rhodanese-related sulfurtransferase